MSETNKVHLSQHKIYIQRCFELALLAGKNVKTNPNVGAVLVHNHRIIGEGYHEKYGDAHAEVNAIDSVKYEDQHLIEDSTLYVSLEPCCIHAKTPPCSDYILKHQISKVVISTEDPNPKVAGQSIKLLENAGVQVIQGVLSQEGKGLIRPFVATLQKRPFIILKFAQSSDAYFGKRDKQIWLSNAYSKRLSHKWRTEIDGILVGYHTARIDNPQLNSREWDGHDPSRIILDKDLNLEPSLHIWDDSVQTLFITQVKAAKKGSNTSFLQLSGDDYNWPNIMQKLYEKGIYRLLIEGGAATIKQLLELGLWDEARVITANRPLGTGIRAPFVEGKLIKSMSLEEDKIDFISRIP